MPAIQGIQSAGALVSPFRRILNFIGPTVTDSSSNNRTDIDFSSLSGTTLTAPVIAGGLTASGSAANNFSGSTGDFSASTGAFAWAGASGKAASLVATAAAITITAAAASIWKTTSSTGMFSSVLVRAVTPVYVSIFTHNERNAYSKRYYEKQRANLIAFGNVILKHGASWSLGSDYTFLDAWKLYETKALKATTDDKDILSYLHALNPKMTLETHAHAGSVVNYADVAYQVAMVSKQTGIDPSGSSPRIQSGIGVDHEDEYFNAKNGTYGAKYQTYFWKPEALFGASVGNHPGACEEQMTFYSGIWHPKNYGDAFGSKSTTNSLLNIGSGYPGTADLTRSDEPFYGLPANYIKALVRKISSGSLPAGQFYTAVISAHEGALYSDPSGYTAALDRQLTQLDTLVAAGKVIYVTPSQMIDYWKAAGSPTETVPITVFDEFNTWAESHCN